MKTDLKTLRAITILYVEDDEMMRTQTVRMFENLFKKVYVAHDGEIGLDLFKNNMDEIDVIVSDINMPKMDGLAMTKKIRKLNKDIPIVITTAYSDKENTMSALNLGVSKYVTKPLKIGELSESIAELSQKYRKNENITRMTQKLVKDHRAIKEHTHELQDDYETLKNKLEMKSFLVDNYVFEVKTDKFAKMLDVSKRIESFFGFTKDELLGKDVKFLLCDDTNFSELQKSLLEATKLKKEIHTVVNLKTKSGKVYEFTATVVPDYGSDQMVEGYTFYLNINS